MSRELSSSTPSADPAQSRQFIKAAKGMGLEEQGDKFEEVMQKLLKQKGKRGNS
jgi:hypothetical protein